MTVLSKEILNNTIAAISSDVNNVYNMGIVDGARIIKDLINNEKISDIDTLLQVLDVFIETYAPKNAADNIKAKYTKQEALKKEEEVTDEEFDEAVTFEEIESKPETGSNVEVFEDEGPSLCD